jgi:hypothetical protein
MNALTSPKTYAALAAFQAGDEVACGVQVAPIKKVRDNLFAVMTAKGPDRS